MLAPNNAVKFFEGEMQLVNGRDQLSEAVVRIYRSPCAETNRSAIYFQFTTPVGVDSQNYEVPTVRAVLIDGRSVLLSLAQEANTWGVWNLPSDSPPVFGMNNCSGNGNFCTEIGWTFVLDNMSPIASDPALIEGLSPFQYNDSFKLEINGDDISGGYTIDVPSTASVLKSNPLTPLSGRFSGNWVISGASDQGLIIAVSEVPIEETEWEVTGSLLMFLSWYTFDSAGELLWLTGAAQFEPGATQVTVPIELVTNGEFLGTKVADREVVGSVTITGNNCNDLGFEYDLNDLALGSGTKHLKRTFSLETAGYTCRDLEARIGEIAK